VCNATALRPVTQHCSVDSQTPMRRELGVVVLFRAVWRQQLPVRWLWGGHRERRGRGG